jgi:beta-lactamase regulating signal transducer with metallopeptidase domain/peroxiredoxin
MTSWVQILVDLPLAVSILLRVTVVLGVGWILHFCLGRANPRWRVLVWRGVVVGVFLVPMLMPLKYFEIGVQAPASPPSTITSVPVVERDIATVEPVIEIADIYPADSVAELPPETLSISQSSFSIMPWARENVWLLLSFGWTLVAVVIAVRFVAAFVGIRRKVRSSVAGPKHLEVLLNRVAGDLNCGRKPTLMCSTDFASPFLTGLMKPVIVLPERMTDSGYGDELPAVFAHEIAHLQSHDLLWMVAARCFGIVFWFHPLAWKLRDAHSTACEEVCDAVAADYVGNAASYSSTLAQIALEIAGKVPAIGGIPMARSAKIMGRLRILKRKVYSCAPARRWVALFLLVGLAALTSIGGLRLVHAENSRNDNPEIAPTWPANTVSADRKALTRVLDSMVAEQEKMPPFAMHIETKTSLPKRDRTSVEGEIHKIRMRYDIDRFDVSRERYDVFNGKAKPGYRYRHILSSDRNLNRQQYIGEPNQPVTAWLGDRKRARRILDDASTGGFLFNFLGDDKPIAEILRAADSVTLSDKTEDVDGFACHVIEGKTASGRMKIWVDPSHGFRIRRATIHKVPGDLYHGIAIAENPAEDKLFGCREVHIEISDVRLGQANGWYFPRSEKMTMTITKHDGTEERIRYVTERSDVEINPDFEKLGAFVMDGIPDGTQLNNFDLKDFGYGYEWRDGQVRPIGQSGGRTVIGRVTPAAHADANGKTSWADTENIDAHVTTKQYRSSVHLRSDGSFRIENVPPGAHELAVRITEPMPDNPSARIVVAEVTRAFKIEQEAGDVNKPIDLGEIKEWKLTGQIKADDRAPLFEVECIDGMPFKLTDYRGQYVLVHFWATWCVPCIVEMRKLKEVYDLFGKDKRFAMIGLSRDKEEDLVKKYIAKNNIKWPQAWLAQGPQTAIASNYGVYGIPAVFLIGPDGEVIARDLRGEAIKSKVSEALALSGREDNKYGRTADRIEKPRALGANSTAPAPALPAAADRGPAGWGEAVEGIQMRVRPQRQRWYEGETPRFRVDMRNHGTVEWKLGLTQSSWRVELDGIWYEVGSVFSGDFRTLPFGPGAEHKDIEFAPEERSEWNINGKPLKFTPPWHTVRLASHASTRDRAYPRILRVVSNPVTVEVVPAEADERQWGEVVGGLQCSLRAEKHLWQLGLLPNSG